MKITIKKHITISEEIDVEFPVYSIVDVSDTEYESVDFIKTTEKETTTLSFYENYCDDRKEWRIKREPCDFGYLDPKYKSSEEEFESALKRFRKFFDL